MMHEANLNRANWCTATLNTFAAETYGGRLFGQLCKEDQQTCVADLIGDLGHFCDLNGLDYGSALLSAEGHYAYESAPEYQGD